MVVAPNTAVRNPTPTQNNRSVRHQPVISPVATTEVAQPLMMASADAATAVLLLAGPAAPRIRGTAPRTMGGRRPMMLVRVSSLSGWGIGPVGWRRMIPVDSPDVSFLWCVGGHQLSRSTGRR